MPLSGRMYVLEEPADWEHGSMADGFSKLAEAVQAIPEEQDSHFFRVTEWPAPYRPAGFVEATANCDQARSVIQ